MMATIGQNRKDEITTFEELGWFDPDMELKEAAQKTMHWLKRIEFSKHVYPEHLMA